MGQGYSLTTLSAGSAGIDVPELTDLSYEKSLGEARFMKTVRARHRHGLVVAKVVMKPYASMKFEKYIKEILRERDVLNKMPNAMGYHRAFETSSNGFLVRQYAYSSLYDRISTRPFLEDIEKRWLAFQLLTAVKACHSQNIYHGDIKSENALVTSWNWLYLCDFSASFKPTYVPEDNPADFSFFFDISGRRTCYLAPERFLSSGESAEGRGGVTWAMDIFSVGCVIAELFLESPMFNLSQLFRYRRGEFDPSHTQLKRIEDQGVREMVAHMIQLEPESRYSADEYLNFWQNKTFPSYFYDFLHEYMYLITDPTSGRATMTSEDDNLGESDERIGRVYNDFDKISLQLGYNNRSLVASGTGSDNAVEASVTTLPLRIDIPPTNLNSHSRDLKPNDDGTFLFLNIVTSSIRSTARAEARLQACDLLLAFAEHISDEAKLDRVLPFVVTLLDDKSELVKVAALRTLAQLSSLISNTTPVNAYIFPEYIMPRLGEVLQPKRGQKPGTLTRVAYAQSMAPLADTASRFLDSVQALKAEGSLPSQDPDTDDRVTLHAYQDFYDIARADLVRFFEQQTKSFLTDPEPDVRRTFLGSIASLCVFFGSTKTNDVILSHLNTYLNDRDWRLKCALFDTIVSVAVYVGANNLEEFILPLMIQALTDPEEFVVERVLRSFSTMAQLGLFQRSKSWELVDLVSRFTMHPNLWIRETATNFISSAAKFLSVADRQVMIAPLVMPYLRIVPTNFDEFNLLDMLKRPLSRAMYAILLNWANKTEKGLFWKAARQRSSSGRPEDRLVAISSKNLNPNALAKIPKNDEDQQWLTRLRDAGMMHEDEFKVLALRDYIWRVAQRTTKDQTSANALRVNRTVQLAQLGVPLNNITWEAQTQPLEEPVQETVEKIADQHGTPQSIADALMDASTTIGGAEARRASSSSPIPASQSKKREARVRSESPQASVPRISSPLSSSPLRAGRGLEETSHPQGLSKPSNTASDDSDIASINEASKNRHRGSAMDLMHRQNTRSKAIAETSMSSTNAYGKLDSLAKTGLQAVPTNVAAQEQRLRPADLKYLSDSGYKGNDPNVLRLLGSMYKSQYPAELSEFGPEVTPVDRRQWENRKDYTTAGTPWRPSGTLIAMFGEHTGAVRHIVVAPDHNFFLTGSDDGTVRVWDTARLERNLAHRSRQTYKLAPGVKVTALTFIKTTHAFVCTGSDGSVHFIRVDCQETAAGGTRYNRLKLVRQWQVPQGGPPHPTETSYAVHIDHINPLSSSTGTTPSSHLLLATNTSAIHALDLCSLDLVYTLANPVAHGPPTSFVTGPSGHFLLLATASGILDLWDLRFRLRLRSFAFPAASPIHALALHPSYCEPDLGARSDTKGRWVVAAGGTAQDELTAWDLADLRPRAVYRGAAATAAHQGADAPDTRPAPPPAAALNLRPYTPWNPDAAPQPAGLLDRLGAATAPHAFAADRAPRALAAGQHYIVAGGPGGRVRFWDMKHVGRSCVVSDGGAAGGGPDAPRPSYDVVGSKDGVMVHAETVPAEAPTDERASAKGRGKRGGDAVLSLKEQPLLRGHLDAVLSVAVVEYPQRVIVSGDRSGVVFVFA